MFATNLLHSFWKSLKQRLFFWLGYFAYKKDKTVTRLCQFLYGLLSIDEIKLGWQ